MEEKKEAGKHEHHEHSEHHDLKIDNDPDKIISKFGTKMKKNPWIPVSLVLGIVVIVILIVMLTGVSGIGGVSKSVAEQRVIDFATSQGLEATIVNSTDTGPFYEITISIQGNAFPVYVTKDGKNMATSLIPLTADTTTDTSKGSTPQADVPKTDKPKVEAFIFSYCPYGTQFEKALIPVYDLLKNKADINIVAIGAMHGEYEHVETLRQLCIEKNYGRDKLFKYLKAFDENSAIGSCSGTDSCVNPLIQKIYTTLSIDKSKIDTCMTKDAPALYNAQNARASSLGISGSPTFVINGVQVQADRTPEAIKTAVCNAFTTPPSECSQTLSTTAASAGFGASAGTSSGASC